MDAFMEQVRQDIRVIQRFQKDYENVIKDATEARKVIEQYKKYLTNINFDYILKYGRD